MAQTTKSYDARDVILTWGEIELDGAGDGTFVTLTYDEDAVTKHTGAQGHVTAVVNPNDGGAVTWVASQSSTANDRLSAIAALQRRKGVGLIKKPFMLKHRNGTTLAIGPETWIKKEPEVGFGEEHSNREWAFDIAHLVMFVGGSTR